MTKSVRYLAFTGLIVALAALLSLIWETWAEPLMIARLGLESAAFEPSLYSFWETTIQVSLIAAAVAVVSILYALRLGAREKLANKNRAETESILTQVMETVLIGVITIDRHGIIQTANSAIERLFGYEVKEVVGRNVSCLMPDSDAAGHDHNISAYLKTGVAKIIGIGREVEGRRKDGSAFPMDLTVTESMIAGQPIFTGVVYDITERKKSERRLNDALEKYQGIFDNALAGMIRTRISDGKAIEGNRRIAEIFGYDDHQHFLDEFISMDHYADPNQRADLLEKLNTDGAVENFEIRAWRRDGKLIWVRLSARANFAEDYLESVILDTTKENEAEQTLRDAIENLDEGFILFDAEERLVMCNVNYRKYLGLSEDDTKPGETFAAISRKFLAANLGEGEDLEAALRKRLEEYRNPGEPLLWQLKNGAWLFSSDHKTRSGGTVGIRADVTAFKQAEEELRRARDEAEHANRVKTEFLANMTHELRTPLNAVIGFSEIMSNEIFGSLGHPNYRQYAKDIWDSGRHLHGLINDILDVSRIETGNFPLQEEMLSVADLVVSCQRLINERVKDAGLELLVELDDPLPVLNADERRMKQVLLNLLSNAVKFTEPGGTVRLAAKFDAAGCFVFSVSDNGIGIAADDIDTVLTKFGQVDSSLSREHEGAGLGLPLAKSLVELHGGNLTLTSEVGRGTTVSVHLPRERVIFPS